MNDRSIEERNDQFDSAVREKLTGHEPQVPHALWNRISTELEMGEASDETAHMAGHHAKTTFGKWRLAIAAAVILTLTVGTLLYTLDPRHDVKASAATADKVNTTVSHPAATVPVHATEARMMAQTAHLVKKVQKPLPASISSKKATPETVVAVQTTEPAPAETAPAKQDQTNPDAQLALAPVQTENRPVEVGNIPLAALNSLIQPSAVNDEITVIKSVDRKKKHGKKNEESTKVIVIGKKFDTRPDIRYQVPVRF